VYTTHCSTGSQNLGTERYKQQARENAYLDKLEQVINEKEGQDNEGGLTKEEKDTIEALKSKKEPSIVLLHSNVTNIVVNFGHVEDLEKLEDKISDLEIGVGNNLIRALAST
jgi:hypothetical protein